MQTISQMSTENQSAQFIRKLSLMISEHEEIISFSSDGREIIIKDEKTFVNKLLPQYFRHRKWRSFIRQMNMYQFRKLNRGAGSCIFLHHLFWRGNQSNFHLIKRKNNIKDEQTDALNEIWKDSRYQLQKEYGHNSIFTFMDDIMEFHKTCNPFLEQVQKNIDAISKHRKNNETKPKVSAIRESVQLIQQSSRKLLDGIRLFQQTGIQSFGNIESEDKSRKQTNLIIPKMQRQGVMISSQKQEYQDRKENPSNPRNNCLEITPGGSFSSFGNVLI